MRLSAGSRRVARSILGALLLGYGGVPELVEDAADRTCTYCESLGCLRRSPLPLAQQSDGPPHLLLTVPRRGRLKKALI